MKRIKTFIILSTFAISLLFLSLYTVYSRITNKQYLENNQKLKENILDGCYHVYLDVGSNIGIQIRKLFEPEKYPDATVHSIFNQNFGKVQERRNHNLKDGSAICAVGFEPNSHHTSYLKEIEASYQKCGWNVKMLTETAASEHNGIGRFYTDESYQNMEWGGGVLPPNIINIAVDEVSNQHKAAYRNVTLLRLSDFLQNVVGKRKIPLMGNAAPPRIIMKMDIEGSEVDVIPDLILTGTLQYINVIMVEWHGRLESLAERRKASKQLEEIIKSLSEYSKIMKNQNEKFDFNLVNMDDESYYTSKFDFTQC